MPRGKLNQMNGLEEIKMTHFDAKARKHHKQKDVGRLLLTISHASKTYNINIAVLTYYILFIGVLYHKKPVNTRLTGISICYYC